MKFLSYILIALIATVPRLWIENYIPTNPTWWTVILLYFAGRLFGYFEGLKEKEKSNED